MKSKIAWAVGVATVFLGVSLMFWPTWFLSLTYWGSRRGLLTSAAIRVVAGLVLLGAAPTSKHPRVFRVIGAIALIAGLTMPFLPLDFWAEFMRWWLVEHTSFFRWALVTGAILLGSYIAYAAVPRRAL